MLNSDDKKLETLQQLVFYLPYIRHLVCHWWMKNNFHCVAIVNGFPPTDVSNLIDKINIYVF